MSYLHHVPVEISDLVIGYHRHRHGDKIVARIPSGALDKGEIVCLLGPNGAGKSTLLRTLCGFLPPLSGEIRINGSPLSSLSPSEMSKLLSIVLTEKTDIRGVTVRELVGFGRSPYTDFWGRLRDEDIRIVDQSLEEVGMSAFCNRMLQTLSDGERQKVFIAKALAQRSPIIFLDEPTAFLDFPSKVEIMQMLLRLTRRSGVTAFLSTHDVELAFRTADRLWVMDKGQPMAMGTPGKLAEDGTLGRVFCREGIDFNKDTLQFTIQKDD